MHDKFHIAKYLGEAVDKVRRAENHNIVNQDKDTLKGTKYLWLTNPNNWSEQQEASFNELKGQRVKSRQGVVDQGDVFRAVGLPLREGGAQVLQAVVLVGHSCTAQTDG